MKRFQPTRKVPSYDKVVISIRLPEERLNEIDKFAIKSDISRNEFINQCIEFALNNMDSKEISEKKKDKTVVSSN